MRFILCVKGMDMILQCILEPFNNFSNFNEGFLETAYIVNTYAKLKKMAKILKFVYTMILFVSLFLVVVDGESKPIIIVFILYTQYFPHF